MKKLIVPIVVLALFGFGCSPTPATKPEAVPVKPNTPAAAQPKADEPKVAEPSEVQPTVSGEVKTLTPAATDETWKTYTSKSLGFSFQWPTKGRHAPQWEVKHYKDDAQEIAGDCVLFKDLVGAGGTEEKGVVGNTRFCITRNAPEGVNAHCNAYTDVYATRFGKTIAAIEFNKELCRENIPASMTEDEYLKNYKANLDSIVGTFTMNQ